MEFIQQLGIDDENAGASTGTGWVDTKGLPIESFSPVDGRKIGSVHATDRAVYDTVIRQAEEAFLLWRTWPAPKRGRS